MRDGKFFNRDDIETGGREEEVWGQIGDRGVRNF